MMRVDSLVVLKNPACARYAVRTAVACVLGRRNGEQRLEACTSFGRMVGSVYSKYKDDDGHSLALSHFPTVVLTSDRLPHAA